MVQQQALRDLDQAYKNWWRNPAHFGCPSHRKKGLNEGFRVVGGEFAIRKINQRWSETWVPKVGWVRFRLSRPIPADVKSCRMTLDRVGRWHVSFPSPQSAITRASQGNVVGIDRGVATTLATSDGQMYRVPRLSERQQARFLTLQRKLSRQVKGSKARQTTKLKIARIHARLTDRRKNWVEKMTTQFVQQYDVVVMENLNVVRMTRRPKPKPDGEGGFLPNGARAKAGLNRAILNNSWGLFLQRLIDKADASGVTVIKVDPRFTSQQCRACGHTAPENRDSQASFRCVKCDHQAHADRNAAENILARGLGLALAPGYGVHAHGSPAQQAVGTTLEVA